LCTYQMYNKLNEKKKDFYVRKDNLSEEEFADTKGVIKIRKS